jgi:ribosomal-protein-alanine N-acetyltransferase
LFYPSLGYNLPSMLIETQRLLLRPLEIADIDALVQIWTDPDVTHYMGGPRDPEKVCAALTQDLHADTPSRLDLQPVIEKATSVLIGDCGIIEKTVDGHAEYELVYVFAKSAWGKGYATEIAQAIKDRAFEQAGLARIIALIDPENPASERVAERAGLKFEKDTIRPGGKRMRVFAAVNNLRNKWTR